jgi:rubrerythrin
MMSKVEGFLRAAFAGESQANRKYLAFAEKADKEGYRQAARLFRAAAESETVHAHNHLRVLKGIGSTAENLKAAIAGETHEFEHMYPEMIEAARAAGAKDAERTFVYASEVEKGHADLYKQILDGLGSSQEDYAFYVCPTCGYTAAGDPPDSCPVCQVAAKMFKRID